jgi:hypothetical protein
MSLEAVRAYQIQRRTFQGSEVSIYVDFENRPEVRLRPPTFNRNSHQQLSWDLELVADSLYCQLRYMRDMRLSAVIFRIVACGLWLEPQLDIPEPGRFSARFVRRPLTAVLVA